MKRLFLSLLLTLFFPAFSETQLSSSDVRKVMDQLFELHIDQKEMTASLMERSLKIYISHFDPTHAYMLQEEVQSFLHPHRSILQTMLAEYRVGKFSTFFTLDQTIQRSIHRAREWRNEWEQNPEWLVQEAQYVELEAPQKRFAVTKKDLKQRHYHRFLVFLSLQMKDLGYTSYVGKEEKLVALCEKQLRQLENDYLGFDDQGYPLSEGDQQHKVILRTVKSLANSLDAHTAYYSRDEAHAIKVQLEKGMCGIGVVLREGIDGITINQLIDEGPAAKSGAIFAGDTIIEVDGESIEGLSFHKVLEVMRGKEGSMTTLGILRQTSDQPEFVRVDLIRSKIVLADKRVDIESEPFGDGVIGKITLHSFYEGANGLSSEKDLKQAIDQLRAQGPLYGLVLDMRENTGGFLSQAVRVSGLFISSGVVVISKYSDGSVKYYRAIDGEQYFNGPLVVLISRSSASATEIVAQTLKDYGVAVVVGDEQTYGKGTIQHQTVTSDRSHSFFKVTIGRYYTVSGKSTQIHGVKADIHVPSEYHYEKLGEGFLDFPLPADHVTAAFDDPLTDIDPFARKWFEKYYIPTLQKPQQTWAALLPILQENSQKRVAQNRNYQLFLDEIKEKVNGTKVVGFGSNDLQMEESVNIVKDMIFLSY